MVRYLEQSIAVMVTSKGCEYRLVGVILLSVHSTQNYLVAYWLAVSIATDMEVTGRVEADPEYQARVLVWQTPAIAWVTLQLVNLQ